MQKWINLKLCVSMLAFLFIYKTSHPQQIKERTDSTLEADKEILAVYKRLKPLKISGYMQPEFQVIEEKGAKSFGGGDFQPNSNSRFILRRSRFKFDYTGRNEDKKKTMQFVFQLEATEKGVSIRDMYGKLFDTKWQVFELTMGMFNRPFGFEINYSSSKRESPERFRMSQTLMKDERDLGAMISFEPQKASHPLHNFKFDLGLFDGQGLTFSSEADSYKDIIGRFSMKSIKVQKDISLAAALFHYNGGLEERSRYRYELEQDISGKHFAVDSSLSNIGRKAPRIYTGADFQLKIKHAYGYTELRGEYWQGRQTSTFLSTETPKGIPMDGNIPQPLFIRNFTGAAFYLLQNIINTHHQFVIKYDWYDPNKNLSGKEIGIADTNSGAADIKFSTLGLGYINYLNENAKLVFWYDIIKNEKTTLPGYTRDIRDNLFTFRIQLEF